MLAEPRVLQDGKRGWELGENSRKRYGAEGGSPRTSFRTIDFKSRDGGAT